MEAEEEMNMTRSNGNQESPDAKDSSDERVCDDGEKKDAGKDRDCSIDIKGGERICRICHFGDDQSSSEGSELVELGCDCKGELGWSHRHCAEAWFWQKGDRQCEICGAMAKNIDNKSGDDTSLFLMEWNEMRLVAATLDDSQTSSRRCKQHFCRFLAVCLVLAFLLPWLFRGVGVL